MNTREQKVGRFKKEMPTQHAQFVEVETRSLTGSGQPVIRKMLRYNAIEVWRRQATGNNARPSGVIHAHPPTHTNVPVSLKVKFIKTATMLPAINTTNLISS